MRIAVVLPDKPTTLSSTSLVTNAGRCTHVPGQCVRLLVERDEAANQGGPLMKHVWCLGAMLVFLLMVLVTWSPARADDQAEIKALEQRFVQAFQAKDVARIMAVYVPNENLVVFDVVPPRQYVGWNAYKKDWEDFLALCDGPITVWRPGSRI